MVSVAMKRALMLGMLDLTFEPSTTSGNLQTQDSPPQKYM